MLHFKHENNKIIEELTQSIENAYEELNTLNEAINKVEYDTASLLETYQVQTYRLRYEALNGNKDKSQKEKYLKICQNEAIDEMTYLANSDGAIELNYTSPTLGDQKFDHQTYNVTPFDFDQLFIKYFLSHRFPTLNSTTIKFTKVISTAGKPIAVDFTIPSGHIISCRTELTYLFKNPNFEIIYHSPIPQINHNLINRFDQLFNFQLIIILGDDSIPYRYRKASTRGVKLIIISPNDASTRTIPEHKDFS